MRRIRIILFLAVVSFAALGGWRVALDEVANYQLQEDMEELVSRSHNYIRYAPPLSDEEFRDAVVRKAREHDIALNPEQVRVVRGGSGAPTTLIAADYSVPVELPGYSFTLHFTPSSASKF
jgi:hypothetical protein